MGVRKISEAETAVPEYQLPVITATFISILWLQHCVFPSVLFHFQVLHSVSALVSCLSNSSHLFLFAFFNLRSILGFTGRCLNHSVRALPQIRAPILVPLPVIRPTMMIQRGWASC